MARASPRQTTGYDVATYSKQHGVAYTHRVEPISVEHFIDYGDWFTKELVPGVTDITVTGLEAVGDRFRVSFADADPVTVGQVVVATGVLPFARMPGELAGLPADLATHTSEHHHLDRFSGRTVAVIGSGQSALETAALLHESGANAQLVVRRPTVAWLDPNPATISGLGYVKRPVNRLCEGWHCTFWNTPEAFRRLPRQMRITKARTVLGPAGRVVAEGPGRRRDRHPDQSPGARRGAARQWRQAHSRRSAAVEHRCRPRDRRNRVQRRSHEARVPCRLAAHQDRDAGRVPGAQPGMRIHRSRTLLRRLVSNREHRPVGTIHRRYPHHRATARQVDRAAGQVRPDRCGNLTCPARHGQVSERPGRRSYI